MTTQFFCVPKIREAGIVMALFSPWQRWKGPRHRHRTGDHTPTAHCAPATKA